MHDLVKLYTVDRLTYRQIGEVVGKSHAWVGWKLKKLGVMASDGERGLVECGFCGREFSKTRRRLVTSRHFCSIDCYHASLSNPVYEFNRSRIGQVRGRSVVSRYYELRDGNVVHHIDSNQGNNDVGNLMVFADQAAHLRFHRGFDVKPVWDGSKIQS